MLPFPVIFSILIISLASHYHTSVCYITHSKVYSRHRNDPYLFERLCDLDFLEIIITTIDYE